MNLPDSLCTAAPELQTSILLTGQTNGSRVYHSEGFEDVEQRQIALVGKTDLSMRQSLDLVEHRHACNHEAI